MERRRMIYWGVGVAVVLGLFFSFGFVGNGPVSPVDELQTPENTAPIPAANIPVPVPVQNVPAAVNYGSYNIDYMNDNIKGILVGRMGNAKTDFYLPLTGYVNVSRGAKYGVAFVIQNVNPKVPEGNEFAYNFDVDPASVGDCGVSVDEAQSWIESGWASQGMIAGQWREDWNEWYDAMTIRFAFPVDIEPCNVKYDFVITRDGVDYDSRTLEFNLI